MLLLFYHVIVFVFDWTPSSLFTSTGGILYQYKVHFVLYGISVVFIGYLCVLCGCLQSIVVIVVSQSSVILFVNLWSCLIICDLLVGVLVSVLM